WTGIAISLIGMYGGLFASYEFGTPPGATITLMFVFLFIVVSVFKSLQKLKKAN
ncbi:MAG TPA: metal ABC transporter permease, partial [Candidatus Jeotgalibaca merdavium]|nr:metal ABC transporter permease [Candidatus Jeotgalibaca merdavium]